MTELVVGRLKALALDGVSCPIARPIYNLGLDEFIVWFSLEPRPAGFTGWRSSPSI